MNDNYQKVIKNTRGFTLLEMIVVIVIIGVLMTLTAVIYGGVQSNARNVSVLSDVDKMESLQTNYGLKTNTSGKSYYSGDGPDTELGFTASDGNVITVTVNSTDYCIRGYNPTSSYSNVQNAYIRESSPGVCAVLVAVTAPDAPITSVALIGADVVATINPVVCSGSGTVQYSMEGRIDDGLWSGWSAWSDTAPSDSQLAEEGVKYGYHSRARCYVNTTYYSDYAVGGESTYTHPVK